MVSIVIRTRNIEKQFCILLRELSLQTLKPSEIITVNNYSSEKEIEDINNVLLTTSEKYLDDKIPIKLISISDSEFSHPYSTNVGINASNSELVCITNGHSLPISPFWLARGVEHFKNPRIAGVSGYFHSHNDGSIYEKIAYNFFWPVINEIRKVSLSDKYFSTINCIVRKSLWKMYPFDENLPEILPESKGYGGEDYDWAQEMRARGYGIVLDTRFNVYHSHGQTLPEILTRNFKWYGIRREIDLFKRPRKSYTRLEILTAV